MTARAAAASSWVLLLALGAAGCDRAAPPPAIERLLDVPAWRVDGTPRGAADVRALEVVGDVRPGFEVDEGATLECDLVLPEEPAWLDVEAALLPVPGDSQPPPAARLTVELVASGITLRLHDAIPSPGTPPTAFGFGRARVELFERLGEPATLRFRVTRDPAADPGGPPRRAALANPRLSPRVGAGARGTIHLELFCAGPDRAALAAPDGAQRWPAFARLVELGASWRDADASKPAPQPGPTLECVAFGPLHELLALELPPRSWDRLHRTDPYGFRLDDPFVTEQRGFDEALLRDRCRALGERALFLELARPRRTRLQALVATRAGEGELDGALARLLAHLAANELLEGAQLVIHVLRSEDGRPSRVGAWERLDG